MVKVGDEVDIWHKGGTVMEIFPYTGLYKQWYNCVLRLTAPNTDRGWMELAYYDEDYDGQDTRSQS